MKRLTVDELQRLAFVWAEQDRDSLAQAWPEGPEREKAKAQCRQLREYRLKRWGKTKLEVLLSETKTKDINEL